MRLRVLLIFFLTLCLGNIAFAQRTASVSGDWNSTATWGGQTVPGSGDAVTINPGISVTVSSAAYAASVSLGNGSLITVNSSVTLTVSGAISIPHVDLTNVSVVFTGGGSIAAASLNIGNATVASGKATVSTTLTSDLGTLSLSGNLTLQSTQGSNAQRLQNAVLSHDAGVITVGGTFTTINGANSSSTYTMGAGSPELVLSGATPFTLSGTGVNTLTFTGTGATVNYAYNGAQSLRAATYTNLTLSGSGNKTIPASTTVNGTVSMQGTAAAISNAIVYGGSGTLEYKGSAVQTSTSIEFPASSGPLILKVNNSSGVNLHAARTVGTLTIGNVISGSIFNDNGNQLTSTGTLNLTSGTLALGNGISSTSFPAFATVNIAAQTTVDYKSTAAQTIAAVNYYHLSNSGNGSRTLSSTGTIGVAGAFTPSTGTNTVTSSTVNFNAPGAQTVPAFNYYNLTISGNMGGANLTLVNGGTIGVAGVLSFEATNVVYVKTGNTIDFNGSGAQTIPAFNYNNLSISGSKGGANVTLVNGTIGVAGTFSATATNTNYIITGNTFDYNGAGAQTISALNYNNLTISGNRGGTNVTLVDGGTIGIAGTFSATATNASYIITGNTIDFNGAGIQTIPAFNYNNLNISGDRAGANVTLANAGTIGIAGTFSVTATNIIYIKTANTVNFNGSGSQSIPAFEFNNLTISGSRGGGIITLVNGGTIGITGSLSITASGTSYTITGNTIDFHGSTSQAIPAFTYNNLTLSNSGGATISADINVNGVLSFSSGIITTGVNKVILGSSASISGAGSGKYVYGNLRRGIPATSNFSADFAIGDASNYTPVTILFSGTPGGSGTLDVSTAAEQPPLASGISQTKYLNRKWTLVNNGVTFTSFSSTFNFVAGDIAGSANPLNFIIAKNDGGTWSAPGIGNRTSTSTQSVSQTSFSDYYIGESVPATRLVITGNSTQTAGAAQNITITAKDDAGNTVTGYTGDKSLTFSGANSSLSPVNAPTVSDKTGIAVNFGTGTTITFTNGVATVSGSNNGVLKLYKAEAAVIAVTDGTISSTGADRLSVTVSAGAFNKMTVSLASPQINSTAFTGTNILTALDAYGNTVTSFDASSNNITVTSSLSGSISGLSNGDKLNNIADFSNGIANLTTKLTFTGTAGTGTFTFTPASGTAVTSSNVTVTAGSPAQLTITTQPVGGASGAVLSTQPVIAIRDAQGNLTGSTASVSVAIKTGTGGTLGGTTSVTAVAGTATFTNLTLAGTVGENYTLEFSSGSLVAVVSTNVTVSAGTPTQLVITTQPVGGASGAVLSTQPVIAIRDAQGNLTGSTASVSVAIKTGTGGTLGGTTSVTAVAGTATFTNLTLAGTVGENYTLEFTSTGLTAVTSSNVTVTAGSPSQLTITTQPVGGVSGALLTTQPVIAIRDAQGNLTGSTASVSVSIKSGAGGNLGGAT
uniref:beta strand repeat-containing protein n=1 Tax=Daejeonella sp. H1SJ63 TaxID=3034145 RepID=UPI0023ECB8DC